MVRVIPYYIVPRPKLLLVHQVLLSHCPYYFHDLSLPRHRYGIDIGEETWPRLPWFSMLYYTYLLLDALGGLVKSRITLKDALYLLNGDWGMGRYRVESFDVLWGVLDSLLNVFTSV
jgi:hypothetical protein